MAERDSPLAILLVDDDPGIRSSLSRILRRDGYRVDLAASATEALDRDHWSDYFAILLDRRLPDNAADNLLPQIIKRAPDAAVVVVTAYADLESSLAAIRAGAADYLLKPVAPDELRVRLRRFADLKQSREEVRKRDRQIEFMIEHLPAGAAYVDAITGELRVNRMVERLTGFLAGELPNRDAWFRNVFRTEAAEYRRIYDADRQARFPRSRIVPIRTKAGLEITVEFSAYQYDEHEVWLINDVTELLRSQEQLRQQRDFSDRLLETAQVIVLVLDPEANIIRYNRFMQELTGFPLVEVAGASWFETFIPTEDEARIRDLFQRVVNGEDVAGYVNAIRSRSGREHQIAWWAKTLQDSDGRVTEVLSIGHDVTALKDVQDKLVQSERLAAIGQMIAGLAHESRNALQRARACLDMLSLDLGKQPKQLELTGRVQTALDELQRLYEEVRGYAAPIKLSLGRYDLAEIWRQSWRNVIQTHESVPVTLAEQSLDVDTFCVVDRHRMEQVFRNVLENAISVSSPDDQVALRCDESALEGKAALRISITDQGPGLTLEQAERIFEPFFTTKQKGTGLGMAISQRIVEALGGTLCIADRSESGATIEITIPRRQAVWNNQTV